MMAWHDLAHLFAAAKLPGGYRFEMLGRGEVRAVVERVDGWYPDIGVGAASCFGQPEFYWREVMFDSQADADFIVVCIKHAHEIVGVIACEREPEAQTLYGRLVIVAPGHRGAQLGLHAIAAIERLGRLLGLGLIYGLATLKIPHVQRAFECLGWQLVGIAPGYDRELLAGRGVKRVFEAIYAKVLVDAGALHQPDPTNMTPAVRSLFELLFEAPRRERDSVTTVARPLHQRVGEQASIIGRATCPKIC